MPFRNNGLHSHDGTHGKTGLGDLTLPEAQHTDFDPRIASRVIYETALEEKGELELLVIGPMTNIAIALLEYPELPSLIKHIWFMGGAAVGGNVNTTAEFNIWVDPEAAHVVMESGIPMTMAFSAHGQMLLGQYARSWMGCSDQRSVGHDLTTAAPSSIAFSTTALLSPAGSVSVMPMRTGYPL